MIRILGTVLGGLLGLAFGSFLNVCLSRWPEGESIVKPRSHCRNCGRTLAWWENIPVASWLALGGRCRTCKTKISWRYPLVELAVGVLWATEAWRSLPADAFINLPRSVIGYELSIGVGFMIFLWLLVALSMLDAEHLRLPNWLTWPGIGLGIFFSYFWGIVAVDINKSFDIVPPVPLSYASLDMFWRLFGNIPIIGWLITMIAGPSLAALLILLIRWTYWLVRRREGIGLGDAKLMAMLGAWLGLPGALLSFAIGVVLGAIFALVALVLPVARRESNTWLSAKLPLGTFLCIGGIISALWGQPIIDAYLRWARL